jgi:hypothetical protein
MNGGTKKYLAERYKGQILLNYSQLYFFEKKYKKGLEILMANLKEFEKKGSEYIGEIYGAIGYAMFLNKNFEQSIDYLKKALKEYDQLGDLEGEIFCIKVLLASAYKIKNIKLYNIFLKEMEI